MGPKGINYKSDGTGRDSYVVNSNGGLYPKIIPGEYT